MLQLSRHIQKSSNLPTSPFLFHQPTTSSSHESTTKAPDSYPAFTKRSLTAPQAAIKPEFTGEHHSTPFNHNGSSLVTLLIQRDGTRAPDLIFSYLDITEIVSLTRVSKALSTVYTDSIPHYLNINARLSHFVSDPKRLSTCSWNERRSDSGQHSLPVLLSCLLERFEPWCHFRERTGSTHNLRLPSPSQRRLS